MDQTAALILLAPVLGPLANQVGVHPLHFGIIMCLNLVIGLVTPPLGACLFTVCSISKLQIDDVVRPLWPLVVTLVIVLLLVTYIPAISLTIPRLLGFA